jgi:hypothetical protein
MAATSTGSGSAAGLGGVRFFRFIFSFRARAAGFISSGGCRLCFLVPRAEALTRGVRGFFGPPNIAFSQFHMLVNYVRLSCRSPRYYPKPPRILRDVLLRPIFRPKKGRPLAQGTRYTLIWPAPVGILRQGR